MKDKLKDNRFYTLQRTSVGDVNDYDQLATDIKFYLFHLINNQQQIRKVVCLSMLQVLLIQVRLLVLSSQYSQYNEYGYEINS